MPITIHKGGGFTVTGAEAIKLYRMVTILNGLRFEIRNPGMRMTRASVAPKCTTIVRREFGLKGSPQKLLEQFEKLVEEQSAKVTRIQEEGESR